MDFEEEHAGGDDIEEIQDGEDIFGEDADISVHDAGSKKDAVIFLVDCKKALFDMDLDGQGTVFSKILSAFSSFMKAKIISSPDDRIGMIFYNTKSTNNQLKFNNITEIYKLDGPSADIIKNCLKIEQNFEKDYQLGNNAHFHECLWLCNHEFKELDKNKFNMRIFLFTPDDLPYFKDQNARSSALKYAKQLKDADVQIELFPLPSQNEFKIARFYGEIITIDLDEVNNAVLDTSTKIMDLHQRIKQKEFKKRALNRLIMDIDDIKIGLKIYCLVNKAKKPTGKPLDRRYNQQLKKKAQFIDEETGQALFPQQISTHLILGNEKIAIPKEYMAKIKGFEKPGMTLIGFKSSSALKDYHNYRASYFLYPDDEHVNGSSQFFDALIQQMILKEKIGIVRLVPKQGSQVRFCALLPQAEQYDENHFQTPPGLHLIFLPYADDIRGLSSVKQEGADITRQTLNAAKILVNALTIQDFDCSNFEDPSIQKFYTYLQGLALQEQNIEEPEDLLQPDFKGMEKYRDIVNLFMSNVSLECSNMPSRSKGQAGGRGRGRGRGRGKQEESDSDDCSKIKGKGRGSTSKQKIEEEDSLEGEEIYQPIKKRGRGR
ncbi:unnamed protein product [Paramecium pentaurelia]|uniref:Ku domain-containing protein n=1 Tax=Paramecium pentaurelia TaxID=43138 RepID=A0A8S1SS28_9CILI|nr:unnamed protein product [Paramecium pentaurelia]